MAEDEKKKKGHHKFKAVTEEVAPSVPQEMETKTEVEDSKPQEKEEKSFFGVTETKNIDLNSKVQERGVFLKFFLITFFATLLAFLLAGGIYVYLTGVRNSPRQLPEETPAPETTQAPTPTPEASPSADLSTFKVSVLNGNGGIGVAGAARDIIEKEGFRVSYIGNAPNFNFTDTEIQVKPSVGADVVAKLKDTLSADYSVTIGDPLAADNTYDIVVTVGSK
jgi:hypothetical protein